MSRILVCGDTHGLHDAGKLEYFFNQQEHDYTKDDYLIICGDVAVCGFDAKRSEATRQFLMDLPVTVLFVDGNHEHHAHLNEYPVEIWNGGKVHMITEDIIHLMRGQIYEIDGRKIFTFGGAYSIDKAYRTEGIDWFEEELPSAEEYDEGWANLEANDYAVDFVFTHTCPSEVMAEIGFGGGFKKADRQTDEFQNMADSMDFKHWFFGHFHVDDDVDDMYHCLMENVVNLDDYV